jgi:hypothetical protein
LEDLDTDGRIILKFILKKSVGLGVDWIDLTQDRDNWQAPLNPVMKFGFYKMLRIS